LFNDFVGAQQERFGDRSACGFRAFERAAALSTLRLIEISCQHKLIVRYFMSGIVTAGNPRLRQV